MDVLSPLDQTVLDWDNKCDEKPVDNYDPTMTINGTGHENGDNFLNDQAFHTPSFGDEEFDIPPINLAPTSEDDANSGDVYGSTQSSKFFFQPLSHHQLQSEMQNTQQHMLPPSPPLSQHSPQGPPACSQAMGDQGMVMTTVTSSPTMTNYVNISQQNHQYANNAVHHQQQQQQQQQQQHDMYMMQLGDRAMMPPQNVQFQVQPYNIPSNFSNGHINHMNPRIEHQQHQLRFTGHQVGVIPQQLHHLPQHHHHHHQQQQQQQQQQQHHQAMMSPSSMFALQLAPARQRPGSVGSSPPGSNHTSPGLETSEDSDDSGHLTLLMGGIKRPSPEPAERPPSGGKPKKPKTQKKKKKRDPNEPQKPVSAYALFFRDTQAAIKGQNPNASFGEVSKIVASMWDGLEIDHKNVYKRKTEAAKKEYLKALAAYRASLVSKAANDPSDNIYGNGTPGQSTPVTSSSPMSSSGGPSPLQKKSPLLTSLMEGTSPINSLHNMTQPQPLLIGQGGGMPHPQMLPQHMQQQQQQQQHGGGAPPHQILQHMLSPGGQMNHMMAQHQLGNHPGQQPQRNGQMNNTNGNNSMAYSSTMIGSPNQLPHPGGQMTPQGNMMCSSPPQLQNCLRNGGEQHLQQQQQQQQENWENREFCNNDCVVSHCRDVYSTWVASRPPPPNSYASVK